MRRISLFALAVAVSGCAPKPLPVQTLGAYNDIRPELAISRAGTRLKLARAAHVKIVAIGSGSVAVVYPRRSEQPGYLQAGVHTLQAGTLQAGRPGECSGSERSVSAFADDERMPTISAPRGTNSRGLRGACVRTSAGPGSYSNTLGQVLVVASEQPLSDEAVEEFALELVSSQASSGDDQAAAARLNTQAGSRGWAAVLEFVRVP